MTLKEALRIKIGDKIYTHSGNIVVISGWYQNFENPCINDDFYFICIDSMFSTIKYRYNELCGPELCDEDKMFIDWLHNIDKLKIDNIPLLKQAFMSGFSCGFSHKQKIRSEEELQK